MTGNRSPEKAFADLVDRTFTPDDLAISKGRALVAAHAGTPQPITWRGARLPLWRAFLGAGALAAAAILVLVSVGGRDAQAPIGGVGSISPSPTASIATPIGRSSSDLDAILAAAATGDSATFATVVGTYQADLDAVSAELVQPGADVHAVNVKLQAEKAELGRALQVASANNKGLVIALQAKLDRILASIGDGPPAPSGHGNGGGTGAGGNGNGSGGNAGGNGGGNGNGAGGNGNGAGNSSGDNGKGHPKIK